MEAPMMWRPVPCRIKHIFIYLKKMSFAESSSRANMKKPIKSAVPLVMWTSFLISKTLVSAALITQPLHLGVCGAMRWLRKLLLSHQRHTAESRVPASADAHFFPSAGDEAKAHWTQSVLWLHLTRAHLLLHTYRRYVLIFLQLLSILRRFDAV